MREGNKDVRKKKRGTDRKSEIGGIKINMYLQVVSFFMKKNMHNQVKHSQDISAALSLLGY